MATISQHELFTEQDVGDILGTSQFTSYFFSYYCKACFQTIAVSRDCFSQKQIDILLHGSCPSCTQTLTANLSCRTVEVPVDTQFWVHPKISPRKNVDIEYPVRFISARALFGLSSGISFIDSLIGGLRSDSITLIKGSRLPLLIAEKYCVRAQFPEQLGGLDGRALFIDGGNSFDVYLFTSIVRDYGLDFDKALNKIIISRAFTPYELLQLVSKDVEQVFEAYNPQLFVINDIFNLFNQDLDEGEARRILRKLGYAIRKTSQSKHVPILMTSSTKNEYFQFLFRDYCDTLVEFNEEENQIRAKLVKHPSKPQVEIVQELNQQPYNQQLLSPLRTMIHG